MRRFIGVTAIRQIRKATPSLDVGQVCDLTVLLVMNLIGQVKDLTYAPRRLFIAAGARV
jgi:hypothetical protein